MNSSVIAPPPFLLTLRNSIVKREKAFIVFQENSEKGSSELRQQTIFSRIIVWLDYPSISTLSRFVKLFFFTHPRTPPPPWMGDCVCLLPFKGTWRLFYMLIGHQDLWICTPASSQQCDFVQANQTYVFIMRTGEVMMMAV